MADASQFPITTPYGYVAGYPLNNGFHNGIDYGCPSGTPVKVNGVTIGLSGATGYATGPHLHVGRWLGGTVTDPGVGGGFHFTSAVVTQISEDATNGKYVRVQGDGASWVYLHLSQNNLVKVGDKLQGGTQDMADKIDVNLSRIISNGILARNGVAGRSYSLDGSQGDPWVGGDLTNQFIVDVFNSPEARGWRDSTDPSSIHGINARLAAADTQAQTIADQQKQIESLKAQVGDNTKWQTLKALLRELIGLNN